MLATERQALPKSCFQSSMVMIMLRGEFFPKLKATMSGDDILAAHDEQQPALNKMREITCRGCSIKSCAHNFKFKG